MNNTLMPNPFFAGRIPPELNDRIIQHCAETSESKTQVLINALSKYLNFAVKPSVTTGLSIEKFDKLEQRVAELEKKLEITNVINSDNIGIDNIKNNSISTDNSVITVDNQQVEAPSSNQTQLSIVNTQQEKTDEVDQSLRNPWIVKTNDAGNLPGLETMGKVKVAQKLRTASASKKTEIRIEKYLFRYYGKEEGGNKSLLWEVVKDNDNSV